MRKFKCVAFLLVIGLLLLPVSALASFVLIIDDPSINGVWTPGGGNTGAEFIIGDGMPAGTLTSGGYTTTAVFVENGGAITDGALDFTLPVALGAWTTATVGLGTSNPTNGSSPESELLLNFEGQSKKSSTINIWLTDTDYQINSPAAIFSAGVTVNNTNPSVNYLVESWSWVDPSNVEFGIDTNSTGVALPLVPPFSTTSFNISETFTTSVPTTGAVSMTQHFRLTNNGARVTQMDAVLTLAPIPEPATLLLMGVGLLGLAAVNRKRLIG